MSSRNMQKVSFLMLLAMALAATSSHARLDQFSQLLASENQPADPNYRGGKIPYTVCRRMCDNCVCDRRAPEYAMCVCMDRKPAAPLHESEEVVQVELNGKSDAEESRMRMPYLECMSKCDDCVACTRMYPRERNTCICVTNSRSEKPAAMV
ncbi:PREDICTED: uncharacterized protein LOC101300651 [Fragaria vesca subsp. vesca]|uniref:uncharacterized protein LOC101300651 n=1 Tax=Fragaria vesca subsp. vesca TaxID=101020 RepID=UPI0002C33274|nr:PREDICTED: uncharacterized protein LOC101300651 [Fragaria vesca subsp. vesca]